MSQLNEKWPEQFGQSTLSSFIQAQAARLMELAPGLQLEEARSLAGDALSDDLLRGRFDTRWAERPLCATIYAAKRMARAHRVNRWSCFATKDVHLADLVRAYFIKAPTCARTIHVEAGVIHRVEVFCAPGELREAAQTIRETLHLSRCWQTLRFHGVERVPSSAEEWGAHFRQWLRARWFDSDHPRAEEWPRCCGPDAGSCDLEPLYVALLEKRGFDVRDPRTLSYWLEYVGEYPARRHEWQRFERKNGPCLMFPGSKKEGR